MVIFYSYVKLSEGNLEDFNHTCLVFLGMDNTIGCTRLAGSSGVNVENPMFSLTKCECSTSMSRPCLSLAISLADARSQLFDVCLGRLDLSAGFAAVNCHDTAGSTYIIYLSLDWMNASWDVWSTSVMAKTCETLSFCGLPLAVAANISQTNCSDCGSGTPGTPSRLSCGNIFASIPTPQKIENEIPTIRLGSHNFPSF